MRVCSPNQDVVPLPMPGNGTLSAAVECTHRFALELARRHHGATSHTAQPKWGLLVLGDAVHKRAPSARARALS